MKTNKRTKQIKECMYRYCIIDLARRISNFCKISVLKYIRLILNN